VIGWVTLKHPADVECGITHVDSEPDGLINLLIN